MSSNNSKITRAQREEILHTYIRGDHAGAQARASSLGLRSDYAYRLAMERGLVPRVYRNWGRLRESA